MRLKHTVSILVLVVFSLYLVPHEAVHVFYDHEDTEHHDTHNTGASFSVIHIHCDFLSTDLTDFLPAEEHQPTVYSVELPFHYSEVDVQNVRCITVLRESRGPPLS